MIIYRYTTNISKTFLTPFILYIECITDQSTWFGPLMLKAECSFYSLVIIRSIPVGVLDEIFLTYFSPPAIVAPRTTRIITVGAQGRSTAAK